MKENKRRSCKGEIDGNNSLARKRKSGEEGRKKWRVEEKVGALRSFWLELAKGGPGVYEEDWKRKLILLLFSGILFPTKQAYTHCHFLFDFIVILIFRGESATIVLRQQLKNIL